MDDYWESFWLGGTTYDRRTRRELDAMAASEASARSRLASQMREQRGDLQAQIDRLTEAFVAMVEYEDTRGQLAEHADAAAVRKWAREVVPTLVVTGGAGLAALPAPPPVHDYWLSWAMRGVVAEATGAADAGELLARARQLDTPRTATLLVLLDALRRRPHPDASGLDALLPASPDLTNAERQLWLAIADGRLGDVPMAPLEARLRQLLGDAGADVEARVRALVPERTGTSSEMRAATTLTALAASAAPVTTPGTGGPEDPLAETVRALVDEGAPGERDILRTMGEVRARMGLVPDQVVAQQWDGAAGRLLDLLFTDLASTSDGRRELAARLLAPSVLPLVDKLRTQASAEPAATVVRVAGHGIVMAADGTPEDGWRAKIEASMRSGMTLSTTRRAAAIACFVVALVGVGLVFVAPLWLLLTVAGVAVGAVLLVQDSGERTGNLESVERRLASADREVESYGVDARERAATLAAARTEAERAAGDVVELMTPSPAEAPVTAGRHAVA